MRKMIETLTVSEVKRKLSPLVEKIKETKEPIIITKSGVPKGVLLSFNHFEGLIETLDILSDRKTVAALRRAKKQSKEGKWFTHEEVWNEK